MNFSQALELLKENKELTRDGRKGTCSITMIQLINDKEQYIHPPYIQMKKRIDNGIVSFFPTDLSCESIFATDWKLVE